MTTLSALLSKRAEEHPRKTFIRFEKRKLSYSEIDEKISLTARGLKKLGLNTGDRIAILMENCPEYIISYFAILRAGGIVVPINIFLTSSEVSYILKDCGCRMLIYGKKFSSHAGEIKNDIPDIGILMFPEISHPHLTKNSPFPPLSKGGEGGFAEDEGETAVILYTSGTTGFPKGAMLTHKNLLSNAEACIKVMRLTAEDRILLFLPLFHAFTFTVCVILPVYAGACIVLLPSVKPFSRVLKSIFKDRITLFIAVPAIYNILARRRLPFFLKYILKYFLKIKTCVSGAAALPEETLNTFEKRFNLPLLEGYGLTEASPVVSVNPLQGVRKAGSVGPPLPGIEVITAGDDGRFLEKGSTGELAVKGDNVMKGYFNKKEETEAVLKNGWLYTGDIAKIDEDGYIFIVDRKKDLIIIDGMNVYPREVEDIVLKNQAVEECAMVGIPDGKGSEIPLLYIKKRDSAVLNEQELREFLKGKAAQFKMPRRIIFIEEFPKTATGKIKKAELRKLPSP
ncbi:MAG: long-chain fatty acid--CoA ligase [Nitrospirae bacterium]|nr:long-chain fatty acid--CoA ligase [Nitrospirota bacterium]MBI4838038.1 long-chain fatty acid--CoA ligase [Nitrospirota bacterium]